jgi:hypothetical protein
MNGIYELIIGDKDGDEGDHRHVKFNIVGWKQAFNEDCSEYFEISGICKPERADAILKAVNAFQSLKNENARLRAALKFYAEAWCFTTNPKRAGLEWKPKEELLDDCGNIARSAIQDGGSNV